MCAVTMWVSSCVLTFVRENAKARFTFSRVGSKARFTLALRWWTEWTNAVCGAKRWWLAAHSASAKRHCTTRPVWRPSWPIEECTSAGGSGKAWCRSPAACTQWKNAAFRRFSIHLWNLSAEWRDLFLRLWVARLNFVYWMEWAFSWMWGLNFGCFLGQWLIDFGKFYYARSM